jgi:hypothetical protein
MLLESSLILINIFLKNIFILSLLTIFLIALNLKLDNNFFIKGKKIVKFLLIYLFYCIVSIIFIKNGVILFKVGNFYITKEGLEIGIGKFLRIFNFLLISLYLSVKYKNYKIDIKHPNFEKTKLYYKDIFKVIFETVPYIIDLAKKRVKFTKIYKKILIKVYRNL